MKTQKLFKGMGILAMVFIMLAGFSVQSIYAQEDAKIKKVRVKVLHDEDGVITEIDTSFEMLDDADMAKIINIKDFDGELAKEIEEKLKEIELELDIEGIDCGDLVDSIIECHVITKFETDEDGEESTIIIKKLGGSAKIMKDHEGVFITKPGRNKVVDVYMDDLGEEFEGKIVKDSIKVICIKVGEKEGEQEYKIMMDCIENLDKDSLIRTIDVSMDDAKIVIRTKVIILDVEKEEMNELEESGVKIAADSKKPLNIDNLNFYPNPSTGQFKLSFSLEDKGDTDVKIYDMSGREVYSEKLNDFSGSYDKFIDISENANGTYFLHVSQGKAAVVKKIILQ